MTSMDGEKNVFLDREILSLVRRGAFTTRGGVVEIYRNGTETQKNRFWCRFTKRLVVLCRTYRVKSIDDPTHVENIRKLQDLAHESDRDTSILHPDWRDGKRFGIAQKVLNLYLKYQWVLGRLDGREPPHCPIDATVIQKIGQASHYRWTKINEQDYRVLIDRIREKAQKDSIARWELALWNGTRQRTWIGKAKSAT